MVLFIIYKTELTGSSTYRFIITGANTVNVEEKTVKKRIWSEDRVYRVEVVEDLSDDR